MRRALKRIGLGLLGLLAPLLLTGSLMYAFGTMERPSPAMRARYDALVGEGKARPVSRPAGIPIPGCRCHSDDPTLVLSHQSYRIRECSSCHED